MDTPEKVIQWHRLSARVFVEGSERYLMHEQAADTIERQAKQLESEQQKVRVLKKGYDATRQERDAALAEVERLGALLSTHRNHVISAAGYDALRDLEGQL